MKIKDLLERSGVQSLSGGCGEEEITALTYDSRKAQTGSLFFCLRGARSNGEDFAPAAYAQGCRCFVSEGTLDVPEDADVVRVSDARQALAQISAAFFDFPQRDVTIIGVTGTKGKTTVAETACSVMNRMGLACGVIGSSGAAYAGKHVGTSNTTPESYELMRLFRAMRDEGVRYVVMEVSSQALARHRVDGITFDTAVFTNLSPDHIGTEEHPDYAHYRDSKKRLFAKCRHGIFNADDPEAAYMMAGSPCEKSTYAIHRPADLRAERVNILKAGDLFGMEFTAAGTTYHIRMPGEYNVYNALAVVALVGRYTDRTCELAEALSYVTVPGRFEVLPDVMPGCTVVLDFAHNSISMNALLQTARSYDPARIIAVFGTGGRTRVRRHQLGEAVAKGADLAIITTDDPDRDDPAEVIADIATCFGPGSCPHVGIVDRREAVRYALEQLCPGDMLLLCGKGREGYQLVQGKKIPYDEEETVRSCARELLESRPQAL